LLSYLRRNTYITINYAKKPKTSRGPRWDIFDGLVGHCMTLLCVNDCGKTATIKKFHGLLTHITRKCSRQDMTWYANATSQSVALEQRWKALATFIDVSQCADTWTTSAGFGDRTYGRCVTI
jgi:hypothetical protein